MRDTPPNRLIRRTFGCLIKVPLGCLAFVAGAGVVGVLALPPVLGGLSVRAISDGFAESHAGRLVVERAWLGSIYDEQAVEGVALYDPEGREILRGSLRAPSLGSLFDDAGGPFGPVEIHVEELRLERGADGRTNLERALESSRFDEDWRREFRNDWELDTGHGRAEVEVVVRIDRLLWTDAEGRRLDLAELESTLTFGLEHDRVDLKLAGGGAVLDEHGLPLSVLTFTGGRKNLGHGREPSPWSFGIETGPAPLALPLALLDSTARLEPWFGERLERLELDLWGGEHGERRIDLRLEGPETSARLAGLWPRGVDAFVGGAEDVCQVQFAPGSGVAQRALAEILPLTEDLEVPPHGRTTLLLSEFTLPFDGDLERFEGRGTFVTDRLTYSLEEAPRRLFRSAERERLPRPSLEVRFDGQRVLYERFGMPAGGVMLQLSGEYDLEKRDYRLEVKPPGCEVVVLRGRRGNVVVE